MGYGASMWGQFLAVGVAKLLQRAQITIAVRVICGYRTLSFEAACDWWDVAVCPGGRGARR